MSNARGTGYTYYVSGDPNINGWSTERALEALVDCVILHNDDFTWVTHGILPYTRCTALGAGHYEVSLGTLGDVIPRPSEKVRAALARAIEVALADPDRYNAASHHHPVLHNDAAQVERLGPLTVAQRRPDSVPSRRVPETDDTWTQPALTRDYVEDRCYDGICTGGRTRPYTGVCPGGHAARYTGVTDGQMTFQSGCGTHLVPVKSAGAAVGAQS